MKLARTPKEKLTSKILIQAVLLRAFEIPRMVSWVTTDNSMVATGTRGMPHACGSYLVTRAVNIYLAKLLELDFISK